MLYCTPAPPRPAPATPNLQTGIVNATGRGAANNLVGDPVKKPKVMKVKKCSKQSDIAWVPPKGAPRWVIAYYNQTPAPVIATTDGIILYTLNRGNLVPPIKEISILVQPAKAGAPVVEAFMAVGADLKGIACPGPTRFGLSFAQPPAGMTVEELSASTIKGVKIQLNDTSVVRKYELAHIAGVGLALTQPDK
ncbi:hypothetical protein GPECTOR_12g503 [Gonium pectorale]|uniref:Uncharacterized protein n=1 Tax=Gonium pectorale TaxID=33097 RepID=A0A150GQB4_GONPE|nr:hypothetical protein GPECTOR_12g503 [Gonium pectorale]|eukprot:KXZ51540.1 hypothetical protein GPECTOR_12g503 [Gonium pectorale]